jgi:hypothetical protein
MSNPTLTPERLRQVMDYDPSIGVFRWRVKPSKRIPAGAEAGSISGIYRLVKIDGRPFLAHRLAFLWMTGEWPLDEVDHRDTDPLNNRWSNLRAATGAQNRQNMRQAPRSNRSTGLLGASFDRRTGLYKSQIMVGGRWYWLGRFPTAEAAHEAYLTAKRRLHPFSTI